MEEEIGEVSTFFAKVNVAAIKLSARLVVGDLIRIRGATTNFETEVDEIQINRKQVKEAKKGDHVGIKVSEKVHPNDKVFLVA